MQEEVGYPSSVGRGRKPVDGKTPLVPYHNRLPAVQVRFLRSLERGEAARYLRSLIAKDRRFKEYRDAHENDRGTR